MNKHLYLISVKPMHAFRGFTEYLGLNRLKIYFLRDTSRDQLHTITPTVLNRKSDAR